MAVCLSELYARLADDDGTSYMLFDTIHSIGGDVEFSSLDSDKKEQIGSGYTIIMGYVYEESHNTLPAGTVGKVSPVPVSEISMYEGLPCQLFIDSACNQFQPPNISCERPTAWFFAIYEGSNLIFHRDNINEKTNWLKLVKQELKGKSSIIA